jgi:hypothetical protein
MCSGDRDIDWMLHVNAELEEEGMPVVFNLPSAPVKSGSRS